MWKVYINLRSNFSFQDHFSSFPRLSCQFLLCFLSTREFILVSKLLLFWKKSNTYGFSFDFFTMLDSFYFKNLSLIQSAEIRIIFFIHSGQWAHLPLSPVFHFHLILLIKWIKRLCFKLCQRLNGWMVEDLLKSYRRYDCLHYLHAKRAQIFSHKMHIIPYNTTLKKVGAVWV